MDALRAVWLLVLATAATEAAVGSPRLQHLADDGGSRTAIDALPILPYSQHQYDSTEEGRIHGGQDVQDLGEAPYQAALRDAYRGFFCAASIISKDWVMTAGHCVDWTTADITVRVGTLRLSPVQGDKAVTVKTTPADRTIHPHFDIDYLDNDIALIRLSESLPLEQDKVEAIVLPRYGDAAKNYASKRVSVTGWGRLGDGSGPETHDALQIAELTLTDGKECEDVYGNAMIGTKLCATTASGQSTCTGDSGGPVREETSRQYFLVGVISFGHKSGCTSGKPVVFTRVSAHLEFIEKTTGIPIEE